MARPTMAPGCSDSSKYPTSMVVSLLLPTNRRFRAWEGGILSGCCVTRLGPELWRLDELSIMLPLQLGDEFSGRVVDPPPFPFRAREPIVELDRRVRRSGQRRFVQVFPRGFLEDPGIERSLRAVEDAGGAWCVEFGGVLTVSLPSGKLLSDVGL